MSRRLVRCPAAVLLAALGVAIAPAPPAAANDSTAELTTGGLVFVENRDVEMRSEDLFISTGEIRVRYRFFNKSDKDVVNLVAFPMPDITVDGSQGNTAIPSEDPVNLLGFSTAADGKPVATKIEQRVLALGIDRTELLKSLGIPLAPHLATTNEALDKVPFDKLDELVRIGMVEIVDGHPEPRWTLKTTFFWEQTFPAQRELIIEHRYKPSVGGSVGSVLAIQNQSSPEIAAQTAEYRRKYCIENDILAAVRRTAKPGTPGYFEQRIAYVLKTGANWAGPIGDFRLVVDKGAAANLISFCGSGVKKISATQFELHKTNFTPTEDLFILILVKPES